MEWQHGRNSLFKKDISPLFLSLLMPKDNGGSIANGSLLININLHEIFKFQLFLSK